jgi:hypothetical protein
MDDILKKELKDTILKTISNGIAYSFMTPDERDQKEQELIEYLKEREYQVLLENCMIYVLSEDWQKILMMELTRNTLYFSPVNLKKTSEVVYYVLQFTAKGYLDTFAPVKKKTKKEVIKQEEDEVNFDEEEETEDDKPIPNFDFL